MDRKKMIKGYLCAICSAVIYGCMPLMAKLIYMEGVSPMTLVFLRNFLALPVLAFLALWQGKTLAIPLRAMPSITALGVMGYGITTLLLFNAYNYIASGTATVLHFIYPAVVVVAGMLMDRDKIRKGNIISVVICVVGVSFFYSPGEPLNWRGIAVALLSGVTYAGYILMLSGFRYKKITGFLFSFYVAAATSAVMLAACLVAGQLALPQTLKGWALCTLFSVVITAGAVVLFQQGTFMIGGERASILSTLEPLTSVLVGVVVFREPMGMRVVLGSLLVLLASFLIAFFDMRQTKEST